MMSLNEMLSLLGMYFRASIVRHAFAVCVLVSLCAAVLGVILVLKRFSFLGDGLSHYAFGIVALSAVLGLSDNMALVIPLTCLAAILLLRVKSSAKIKGDASTAVISVSSLAIGYLLLSIFPSSGNVSGDVCTTLFGSQALLTLKQSDVTVCLILSVVILALFVFFYEHIFAVTFDESYARSTGVNVELFNTLIAVLSSVVIVMAMKFVGSLLISALIVFPALSAMRLCKSFRAVIVLSGVLSVVGAAGGLVLSLLFSTPAGATVVAVDLLIFCIFYAVGYPGKH